MPRFFSFAITRSTRYELTELKLKFLFYNSWCVFARQFITNFKNGGQQFIKPGNSTHLRNVIHWVTCWLAKDKYGDACTLYYVLMLLLHCRKNVFNVVFIIRNWNRNFGYVNNYPDFKRVINGVLFFAGVFFRWHASSSLVTTSCSASKAGFSVWFRHGCNIKNGSIQKKKKEGSYMDGISCVQREFFLTKC